MKRALCCILALLLVLSALPVLAEEMWYPQMPQDMPSVYLTTDSGHNHFAQAYVREHKLQGLINYVAGSVSVEGGGQSLRDLPAQLKVRGNWTLDYPKKSIRIKLEEKQNLLGLNGGRAFKSWVLLAEWKDLSMLNSATGLFLAHNILGPHGYYCTDYQFVHVYINQEYWGVYLLAEQQEVNPGRVAVAEPDKDNFSRYTGYLMEYDAYFNEEAGLPSSDPVFQVYHTGLTGEQYGYTIKSQIDNNLQRSFLRSYMRLTYRACYEAIQHNRHYAFNDKLTELVPAQSASAAETVGRFLDLPSLVDTYLLQEIACNPDLGWSSFYISLDLSDNGSKTLVFQAPWDFDSSFGIRAGYERNDVPYVAGAQNPWLQLVADQPWFEDMVRQRWQEIKAQGLPEKTLELITGLKDLYAADFQRNSHRWPSRIAEGNHELIDELNNCRSQQEAADYLRHWLTQRFSYLDSRW